MAKYVILLHKPPTPLPPPPSMISNPSGPQMDEMGVEFTID